RSCSTATAKVGGPNVKARFIITFSTNWLRSPSLHHHRPLLHAGVPCTYVPLFSSFPHLRPDTPSLTRWALLPTTDIHHQICNFTDEFEEWWEDVDTVHPYLPWLHFSPCSSAKVCASGRALGHGSLRCSSGCGQPLDWR